MVYRPQNKRGARGPRALADLTAKLTKPLIGRRGFAKADVITDWPQIVGPDLARVSAPERLIFSGNSRAEGTLHLRVEGGGPALELQHYEPLLIEKINSHFGFKAVARVKLVQGPLPHKESRPSGPGRPPLSGPQSATLEGALQTVTDPEVRAALERLGRSVLARKPKAGDNSG